MSDQIIRVQWEQVGDAEPVVTEIKSLRAPQTADSILKSVESDFHMTRDEAAEYMTSVFGQVVVCNALIDTGDILKAMALLEESEKL